MDFMAVGMLDVKEPTEYAADAVSRIRAYLLGTKRPWFHRHRDHEFYYDLCADEPNGPKTYHGIGWACSCDRITYGGSLCRITRL